MFAVPRNFICFPVPLHFGHLFPCSPEINVILLFPHILRGSKQTKTMHHTKIWLTGKFNTPALGKIEMVQCRAMHLRPGPVIALRGYSWSKCCVLTSASSSPCWVTAGLLVLHLNVSKILYTYLSRFEQGVYHKNGLAVQGIYCILPRGKLKSPLFLRPLGDMVTNYWCITLHRVSITRGRLSLSWGGGKQM